MVGTADDGRPRRGELRWPGRLVAVAAVSGILIAACGSTPGPTPSLGTPPGTSPGISPGTSPASVSPAVSSTSTALPSPTPQPVAPARWSDCGRGFECARILVPRDYSDSAGPQLQLALVRLRATDPSRRIGSLVVNPGGPGASGIDFVREGAVLRFPEEIRARFDIVGFDPRGVNASSPVRCVDNLDHFLAIDLTPDNATELEDLIAGTRQFVAGCARRNGDLLPFLGTENVARDLDRIRAAIGDEKLTYAGFSYGTLIGSMYADRFPDRVRALVLDGALDPTLDLAAIRAGQSIGFEKALNAFFADCAKDRSCLFRNGGHPAQAFDALMARIERKPLPAIRIPDLRTVGPAEAWSAVAGALYSREAWPALAASLELAEQGDGSLLLLIADPYNGRRPHGGYSNLIDANTAVNCLDFPAPRDPDANVQLARRLSKAAPRFGALLGFTDIDCAFWPVPPDRTPAPIAARGAPPIVVVGTTGDPATPYDWAVRLANQLASGVLVTRKGEGHTAYGESHCVDAAVDAYLIDLKVPKDGLVCSK